MASILVDMNPAGCCLMCIHAFMNGSQPAFFVRKFIIRLYFAAISQKTCPVKDERK